MKEKTRRLEKIWKKQKRRLRSVRSAGLADKERGKERRGEERRGEKERKMGDTNASVPDPNLKQYDDLREAVKADATDFDSWTKLITVTEQLDALDKLETVYDGFLAEYPLCYGYWKKYADANGRHGGDPTLIYERGVGAMPYSVDMWTHYIQHLLGTSADSQVTRKTFERALEYVGGDYLSHPVWDKYIDFETNLQATVNVSQIYDRVLSAPTQQIDRYFESFKQYVASKKTHELMTGAEIEQEKAKVDSDDEEKLKGSWMEPKTRKYQATKDKVGEVATFEKAIKRPYFHVKPLDDAQLEHWHEYLDHAEKNYDDVSAVACLYERCLIPCASYTDFWIRYACYMESAGDIEKTRDILERATGIHTKTRPECYLFKARFEESCGETQGARECYEKLLNEVAPGLLQGIVAHANMERRASSSSGGEGGGIESARKIFEKAMEREKDRSNEKGGGKVTFAQIAIHYARFSHHVEKDSKRTHRIFEEALDFAAEERQIWESYVLFSLFEGGEGTDEIFQRALASSLSHADKEIVSLQRIEFCSLFDSVAKLKDCSMDLMSQRRSRRASTSAGKKRKATENENVSSEAPKRHQGAGNQQVGNQGIWKVCYTPEGSVYYYNTKTGTSQWEAPV